MAWRRWSGCFGEDYDVDGERLHEELVTLLGQLEEERLVIARATATP